MEGLATVGTDSPFGVVRERIAADETAPAPAPAHPPQNKSIEKLPLSETPLSHSSLPTCALCLPNALGSGVALAPVIFFFLVAGVLRAWPHVQLRAEVAWSALGGFTASDLAAKKCFLLPR